MPAVNLRSDRLTKTGKDPSLYYVECVRHRAKRSLTWQRGFLRHRRG